MIFFVSVFVPPGSVAHRYFMSLMMYMCVNLFVCSYIQVWSLIDVSFLLYVLWCTCVYVWAEDGMGQEVLL